MPRVLYSKAISSVMARGWASIFFVTSKRVSNSLRGVKSSAGVGTFPSNFVAASKAASSSAAAASCLLRDDKMSADSCLARTTSRGSSAARTASAAASAARSPWPCFFSASASASKRSTMSAPPWPARSASVAFRRSALASPVRPNPSRAAAYVARAAAAALVSAMHAQALAAGSSASRYLPRPRYLPCRTRTFALTEKAVAVSLARSPQTLWSTSAAAFASWYASFTSFDQVWSPRRSRAWARLNKTSALAARTDAKLGDSSPLPSKANSNFSAFASSAKASSYSPRAASRCAFATCTGPTASSEQILFFAIIPRRFSVFVYTFSPPARSPRPTRLRPCPSFASMRSIGLLLSFLPAMRKASAASLHAPWAKRALPLRKCATPTCVSLRSLCSSSASRSQSTASLSWRPSCPTNSATEDVSEADAWSSATNSSTALNKDEPLPL
mmetsp:Transcript_3123/g.8959  ORF Transcript_3123/g.8959 Transcript_3123/m.8959 type:complete len:445 (+) Transcript_3123:1261-2595(+)